MSKGKKCCSHFYSLYCTVPVAYLMTVLRIRVKKICILNRPRNFADPDPDPTYTLVKT